MQLKLVLSNLTIGVLFSQYIGSNFHDFDSEYFEHDCRATWVGLKEKFLIPRC